MTLADLKDDTDPDGDRPMIIKRFMDGEKVFFQDHESYLKESFSYKDSGVAVSPGKAVHIIRLQIDELTIPAKVRVSNVLVNS